MEAYNAFFPTTPFAQYVCDIQNTHFSRVDKQIAGSTYLLESGQLPVQCNLILKLVICLAPRRLSMKRSTVVNNK